MQTVYTCTHVPNRLKKHDIKCKKQEMLHILIISMIDVDVVHCTQKKVIKMCSFNIVYFT